jgi:hypothetical protein
MKKVDMSAKAVTARLKLISELRRLCLSLQKAKLPTEPGKTERPTLTETQKTK